MSVINEGSKLMSMFPENVQKINSINDQIIEFLKNFQYFLIISFQIKILFWNEIG